MLLSYYLLLFLLYYIIYPSSLSVCLRACSQPENRQHLLGSMLSVEGRHAEEEVELIYHSGAEPHYNSLSFSLSSCQQSLQQPTNHQSNNQSIKQTDTVAIYI